MQKKKLWFRFIKFFHKIFVKKPEIIYLGERIQEPSLVLCNHVGSSGPTVWELYMDNVRFWATHEITEGPVSIYHYLSEVFFLQKKHWSKAAAKTVGFLLAPWMALYASGWELIPSYRDMRLSRTIKITVDIFKEGGNVLIFPENSSEGYHDELQSVHSGFCLAGEAALRSGIDPDLVFAHLGKGKDRRLIIDAPVKFSALKERFGSRDKIAEYALNRINALSWYQIQ